ISGQIKKILAGQVCKRISGQLKENMHQVTSSLSIVDPNAVIEIRDIFKRNKDEKFEANEFEVKGLQSIVEKLQKYHLS
ncbi:hypothetical protein ACV1G4_19100, partial [Acinetobacter baumannii]